MKKKNLLTLGALCLSLGLVVSSCNPSTEGQPGKPGEPGQPGEPGKDGVDGKTPLPIIVVNDNDIVDGTVSQDVYFAIKGEHDSVTFTFTPKDENKNIVIDFEINGEVVDDLDPTAGSYTISDIDAKYPDGIQVTGAVFTSVGLYGTSLLEDYVKGLCESDKSLNLVKSGTTTHFLGEGNDSTYEENAYSEEATSVVQEAYEAAFEDLKEAIETAKKDHKDDVSAQLTAIATAEKSAEEAISAAYSQAIEDAKVQAESDLEDLAEAITDDNYAEENRAADKSSIQAGIDAATTIEGLGNVIDGPSPITSDTEGASGNLLIGAKQVAFGEIAKALDDISSFSDELEDDDLLASLAAWGVSTSELPTTIAESYLDQISTSTDITLLEDSTTHAIYTELGKTGAKAIEDSVFGLKDSLVAAIKAKYESEINDSKVLADQAATKTALLGVLETAIQNYVTADTNETRFSITQYVSTEVNIGTTGNTETAQIDSNTKAIKADSTTFENNLGLIGYIEYCLNQPVNGSTNQAWLAERVANAKASVGERLTTAREAISDETYDKLTSYTTKTVSGTTYYYPEVKVVLEGESEAAEGHQQAYETITNPFFVLSSATSGDAKDSGTLVSYDGIDPNTGSSVTGSKIQSEKVGNTTVSPTYNLDSWLETLTKATIAEPTSKVDTDGVWTGGTLYVDSWVEGHLADFQKIYSNGLLKLRGKWDRDGSGSKGLSKIVKQAALNSGLSTNNSNLYITNATLFDIWESYSNDTSSDNFADAETLISTAEGMKESGDLLGTANTKINEFLDRISTTDSDFAGYFGTPAQGTTSTSSTRKAFEDEVKSIIKGEVSSSQLNSWFNNLDSIYEEDVAEYLETAKDLVTQKYQESVSNATSVDQSRAITNVYNAFNSYVGHKLRWDSNTNSYVVDDEKGLVDLYLCDTIESINKWQEDARAALASVTFNPPLYEKLPGSSAESMEDFNFDDSDVEFKNSETFKLTKDNGVWVASGDLAEMTAEQATEWGTSVGTKFALISYEKPTNATKRFATWTDDPVDTVEGLTAKDTVGDTDGSNTVKVNLGERADGLGSKKYYQVLFTDDDDNILAIYLFDFSAYVPASTEVSE